VTTRVRHAIARSVSPTAMIASPKRARSTWWDHNALVKEGGTSQAGVTATSRRRVPKAIIATTNRFPTPNPSPPEPTASREAVSDAGICGFAWRVSGRGSCCLFDVGTTCGRRTRAGDGLAACGMCVTRCTGRLGRVAWAAWTGRACSCVLRVDADFDVVGWRMVGVAADVLELAFRLAVPVAVVVAGAEGSEALEAVRVTTGDGAASGEGNGTGSGEGVDAVVGSALDEPGVVGGDSTLVAPVPVAGGGSGSSLTAANATPNPPAANTKAATSTMTRTNGFRVQPLPRGRGGNFRNSIRLSPSASHSNTFAQRCDGSERGAR
jgi:hypothetical protein